MNAKQGTAAAAVTLAAILVPTHEGIKQWAYKDPVGIPTICFGHTGTDVQLGQHKTIEECKDLLAKDLLVANQTIDTCVKVPLKTYERAALISFTFNVGPGAPRVKDGLCYLKNGNASSIVRHFNNGNPEAGCKALNDWVYAKGIKFPGLVKRRAEESALCLGKLDLSAPNGYNVGQP